MKLNKKKRIAAISSIAFLLGVSTVSAQTTITLRPGASQGKDAVLSSLTPGANNGTHPEFISLEGTNSGTPVTFRSLIEFDLTSVPKGATINRAKLSLYSFNSPGNGKHRQDGGSNESTLSRVTSAWSEDSVTWNNQPGVSALNQVTLAGSDSLIQDYIDIDVTSLVADMTTDSIGNHGFLLKLVTEERYRTMLFGSSDNADSTLHPKLVVEYTPATGSCVSIRPGATKGKDAVLSSLSPSANNGTHPEFIALEGTNSGTPVTFRSLIQFDLSDIPQGAVIDSAKLSLYSFNSPGNGKHRQDGGSNEATLSRVTSSWSEDSVTWNNQPSVSATNQVTLAGSDSLIQDYLNIDVTALVSDMRTDSIGNHGFLLQLVTEERYRTMLFGSSDNVDSTLHPMLEVCYSIATQTSEISVSSVEAVLFPNPTSGNYNVKVGNNNVTVEVYNASGQLVESVANVNNIVSFDASGYSKGMYFVKVYFQDSVTLKKLLVQ